MKFVKMIIIQLLLVVFLAIGNAQAHGGGIGLFSPPKNLRCFMYVGPHAMRVVGYQVAEDAHQERVCDNFPAPGQISISIDFLNKQLQSRPMAVRIVSVPSMLLTLFGVSDAGDTVFTVPPKLYPDGLVQINAPLERSGFYVLSLRMQSVNGEIQVGRLPFSVGMVSPNIELYLIVLLTAMIFLGYVVARLLGRKKPKTKVSTAMPSS